MLEISSRTHFVSVFGLLTISALHNVQLLQFISQIFHFSRLADQYQSIKFGKVVRVKCEEIQDFHLVLTPTLWRL